MDARAAVIGRRGLDIGRREALEHRTASAAVQERSIALEPL
jgi:hypothetical protein